MAWMVDKGFEFPHGLEVQGVNAFLELNGNIYPSLIRGFYANFQYKDEKYLSVVKGKLFSLDDGLFLEVGGLTYDGSSLGDCSYELWNSYDIIEMYKSYMRGNHHYIQGELTKVGSLTMDNRLLHYLIAYIFVQCNNNHAQSTVNDLKLMFAITEVIMTMVIYHREHLGIYKYGALWKYQEDHNTSVDLDLCDDEGNEDPGEEHHYNNIVRHLVCLKHLMLSGLTWRNGTMHHFQP
ncbi:hypothetical protein Lal_00028373 [Lupinus albus]|nr:hypothetical protein Lal_00028373 [Lupinus albus]